MQEEKEKILNAGRITIVIIALLSITQAFTAAWIHHTHSDVADIKRQVDENRDSINRNTDLLRLILGKLGVVGR